MNDERGRLDTRPDHDDGVAALQADEPQDAGVDLRAAHRLVHDHGMADARDRNDEGTIDEKTNDLRRAILILAEGRLREYREYRPSHQGSAHGYSAPTWNGSSWVYTRSLPYEIVSNAP